MPEWYPVVVAAQKMNCTPWELLKQCAFWQEVAFIQLGGEHDAEIMIKKNSVLQEKARQAAAAKNGTQGTGQSVHTGKTPVWQL